VLPHPEARSVAPTASSPAAPPASAVEEAAALLRLGLSGSEIEQRLVARGVASANASAAVTSALAERARGPLELPEESESGRWVHRLLSALAVAVCIALAYWYGGRFSAGKTLI
jgi:hypothetical protein